MVNITVHGCILQFYILELQVAVLIPAVSYAGYGSCGFPHFLHENSGIAS
jgi:hypothetical protein